MLKFKCHKCSKEIEVADRVGRREDCPQCHADLHACMNCHFYDPKAYNSCKESAADVVQEKDRSNFCDYFTPSSREGSGKGSGRDDLLSAAEALFKKKP